MSPEAAASPERDPALRRDAQKFLGRAAVDGPSREAREAAAPKLGRAALTPQRREETREAAAPQLGRQAVAQEARRSRD